MNIRLVSTVFLMIVVYRTVSSIAIISITEQIYKQ